MASIGRLGEADARRARARAKRIATGKSRKHGGSAKQTRFGYDTSAPVCRCGGDWDIGDGLCGKCGRALPWRKRVA